MVRSALVLVVATSAILSACKSVNTPQASTPVRNPWTDWQSVMPYTPPEKRTPAAELAQFSVPVEKVGTALCRENYADTHTDVLNYFKTLPKNYEEPSNTEISGIQFKRERPDLLEAFWRLTSPAEKDPEQLAGNLQAKFAVNPACTKVICATQAIFGNHVGPKMLYLMHKFSINTSPYSWTNADVFTDGEISDIIKGLELLPRAHLPTEFNQKMIRFKRGYVRRGGENTVANASMEFFDHFEEYDSKYRQHTIIHELSHILADTITNDMDRSKAWFELGGWEKMDDHEFKIAREANRRGHSFVSEYAQAAPWEDFAESAAAYRLNPDWLKKRSEKKYAFMKHMVFDGVEFTSATSCQAPRLSQKIKQDIKKNQPKFSSAEIQQIAGYCKADLETSLFGFLPYSFFNRCVNFEATLIWYENNPRQFESIIPNGLFDRDWRTSQLEFPEVQKQVKAILIPQLVTTLKETLNSQSAMTLKDEPTESYCANYSKNKSIFFRVDFDSKMRKFKSTHDDSKLFESSENKIYGLCLDLYSDYVPMGTGKGFVNYIKSMVLQRPEQRIRGLSEQHIQKFVETKLNL